MGVVDFSAAEAAPWFSLPQFYGMPVFDINAIIMVLPALFGVPHDFVDPAGHDRQQWHQRLMKEPGL